MSVDKSDYLSRLQTLLVYLIVNGAAKTKSAKLSFLYFGEIMKYAIHPVLFSRVDGVVSVDRDSMHGRVFLLVRGDRQTEDAFLPSAHYTIRFQRLPWRRY